MKRLGVVALMFTVFAVFACRGSEDAFIYKVLGSSSEQGVEITITWVVSHPGGEFRLRPGARGFSGNRIDPETTVWGRIGNTSEGPIRVIRAVLDEEGNVELGVVLATSRGDRRRGRPTVDSIPELEGPGYFQIPAGQIRSFFVIFDGTVSRDESPVSVIFDNIQIGDEVDSVAIVVRDIALPDIEPVRIDPYGNLPSVDFREPALLRN